MVIAILSKRILQTLYLGKRLLTSSGSIKASTLRGVSISNLYPFTNTKSVLKALEDILLTYTPAIQKAREQADLEALWELSQSFDNLELIDSHCQQLIQNLDLNPWPHQTPKQTIGAYLFYPSETIKHNPYYYNDDLYKNLGITTCIVLAAHFNDPIALYHLAYAYPKNRS